MTQFTHLVASLGIAAIAAATFSGCGQSLPPEFRRVVSPCLDMAGIASAGQDSLQRLLDADFVNKDANHDGTLTFEEVQRASSKRPNIIDPELFVTLDSARQAKLTQEQVREGAALLYNWALRYRYRFLSRFDGNNDGQLILSELPGALRITQSVFEQADSDRSGGLDATEFLDLVLSLNAGSDCVPKADNGQTGTSTSSARRSVPVTNRYR